MARIWSNGFETGDLAEVSVTSGSPSVQSTVVRSGSYAGVITSLSSGVPKYYRYGIGITGINYIRFCLRIETLPSASNRIFSALTTTTQRIFLSIDNSGSLQLADEDGTIGSATTLSIDTWYTIEVGYDLSGAGSTDIITARLDGSTFATASNRNIASTSINRLYFGGNIASEAQTTGTWYFDDIAINDATGSFQNSWPGIGSIVHLRPNDAGDNNDWSRGGADSGSNWGQVDEVTPNGATDYVASTTLDQIDDYALDSSGLSSGDTVNVVAVNVYARASASSGPQIALRIKSQSAGTVEESANLALSASTYATNGGSSPTAPVLTLYDLPGSSTDPWTSTELDTAQIGVRLSVDAAPDANVSTLWLMVDYTPNPSAANVKDIIGMGFIPFAR